MSNISVGRSHTLGEAEALTRAKELVAEFAGRLNADVVWNGSNATFSGKGFKGKAAVTAENVTVDVELGLLLRALRGTIESRLETALSSKFD